MAGVNRPDNIWDTVKKLASRVTSLETGKTDPLTSTTGADIVLTTTGKIRLEGDGGTFIDHDTTADAANAVITTGGRIRRSTSSRRWKRHIREAEFDHRVLLALVPRRFDSTTDGRTHVGFIAEEADELGLGDWVTYDREGPEAFSYAGWVVALQIVVRKQQEQIDRLTDLVADLADRLGPTTMSETEGPDHG